MLINILSNIVKVSFVSRIPFLKTFRAFLYQVVKLTGVISHLPRYELNDKSICSCFMAPRLYWKANCGSI